MNTMTGDANPREVTTAPAVCDESIRSQVWSVLGALYPRGGQIERRVEQRYPYPYLLHLTPIAEEGYAAIAEPVVVVGKHLSESGLGFYHPKPLPYRRMLVGLESPDGSTKEFVIDLTWCRFTEQGWYESGGRFLEALDAETKAAPKQVEQDQESDDLDG